MKQAKRIIDNTQEYPGTMIWYDYEVFCPECKRWRSDYGDVSINHNGEEHYLCVSCGDRVFPIEG